MRHLTRHDREVDRRNLARARKEREEGYRRSGEHWVRGYQRRGVGRVTGHWSNNPQHHRRS